MNCLLISPFTAVYTDPAKSRSLGSEFASTQTLALKAWLEEQGNAVYGIYNDTCPEYSHIENVSVDKIYITGCLGLVHFGGRMSKWVYKFFTWLVDQGPVQVSVVDNDCELAIVCGADRLLKDIDKGLKYPVDNPDLDKLRAGVKRFRQLFEQGYEILIPGGEFEPKLSPDLQGLPFKIVAAPGVNKILADQAFPTIPAVQNKWIYDVVYAGVWRPDRKKNLLKLLDDERFKSGSVISGLKMPSSKKDFGWSPSDLKSHEELGRFEYKSQQDWYQDSLCQLIVSDPKTFGKFVSARWFTALRTNSIPLVQSEFDPNRDLLREYPELSYLYVSNSEDIFQATQKLKEPGVREEVIDKIHSLQKPWFVSVC